MGRGKSIIAGRGRKSRQPAVYVMSMQHGLGLAFVPDPDNHGRWIRTYPCVVSVDCPACGSKAGTPCTGRYGQYTSLPHSDRRTAADRRGRILIAEPAIMLRLPIQRK
jgi:hypothetical protein